MREFRSVGGGGGGGADARRIDSNLDGTESAAAAAGNFFARQSIGHIGEMPRRFGKTCLCTGKRVSKRVDKFSVTFTFPIGTDRLTELWSLSGINS